MTKKKRSDDWVSAKIARLRDEGRPLAQAVAVALSMAGRSKKKKKVGVRR